MKIKRQPKLIFFDVGHVLVRKITDYEEDAANLLGITQDEFEILHEDLISNQPQERVDLFNAMRTVDEMNEYFNDFHKDALKQLNKEPTEELLKKLLEARYGNYELIEGVVDALEELKKKYRLGIISNAFPSRRTWDLAGLGLTKYFDPIVISFELGIHKPDKGIYEHALTIANIDPSEVMFVDDKVENLESAVEVGMDNCVLIKRKEASEKFPMITSVKDLVEVLKLS